MLEEFVKKLDSQLRHLGVGMLRDGMNEPWSYEAAVGDLEQAIAEFQVSAIRLQHIIRSVNSGERAVNLRQAEMINSRLMNLERCFMLQRGIYQERDFFRHSVFSPSEYPETIALGSAYSLVLDPSIKWSMERRAEERTKWMGRVKEGFANLHYTIESATHMLKMDGFDNQDLY
jgi:Transferrin receptor-like dimerisation domain